MGITEIGENDREGDGEPNTDKTSVGGGFAACKVSW